MSHLAADMQVGPENMPWHAMHSGTAQCVPKLRLCSPVVTSGHLAHQGRWRKRCASWRDAMKVLKSSHFSRGRHWSVASATHVMELSDCRGFVWAEKKPVSKGQAYIPLAHKKGENAQLPRSLQEHFCDQRLTFKIWIGLN
jgi:hypothetical protein